MELMHVMTKSHLMFIYLDMSSANSISNVFGMFEPRSSAHTHPGHEAILGSLAEGTDCELNLKQHELCRSGGVNQTPQLNINHTLITH
jgi:hypothetical protein